MCFGIKLFCSCCFLLLLCILCCAYIVFLPCCNSFPAPYLPLLRLAELLRDAKVVRGNAELQMLGGLIVLIWLVRSQFDEMEFIEASWWYSMEVWS